MHRIWQTVRRILALIVQAVEKAGYKPGEDILIAIDAAASELYDENLNCYYFPGESQMKGKEVLRDSGEMIAYYEELVRKFPIISIEDGLHEDDWEGWKEMTTAGKNGTACRGMSFCYKYQTTEMWDTASCGECNSCQGEPDRHVE